MRQTLRSIPACAGEPLNSTERIKLTQVYPRVCGGTICAPVLALAAMGLSPRVRGNHPHPEVRPFVYGSIPACAGEPLADDGCSCFTAVYPRVCGGTRVVFPRLTPVPGLSPRVRGNLGVYRQERLGLRSIPACAGEPHTLHEALRDLKVYPRVCGGTGRLSLVSSILEGLSPRVRGNPRQAFALGLSAGSIPACAGEPSASPAARIFARVYPRVCGGTRGHRRVQPLDRGLSPRVRGNRQLWCAEERFERSIPACAGEPMRALSSRRSVTVYPRVCGGTRRWVSDWTPAAGLSPRVRGNQTGHAPRFSCARSIPACAGEPRPGSQVRAWTQVYPRVCGGTTDFITLLAHCVQRRVWEDAIRIVKELGILTRTWAGSPGENDALLIYQLDGGRAKDAHGLPAWLARVLPGHDNGPPPKPEEPV